MGQSHEWYSNTLPILAILRYNIYSLAEAGVTINNTECISDLNKSELNRYLSDNRNRNTIVYYKEIKIFPKPSSYRMQ
jgi:hypothetical protein